MPLTESPHGPRGLHDRLGRWLAAAAAVLLLVPLGMALTALWNSTGADLAFTARERDGVTYLRPLTRLLAVTTDAQMVAAQGGRVDSDAVRAAVKDVGEVDSRLGEVLGTTVRWTDLAARLDTLATATPRGRAAMDAYSVVIDLELALIGRVGDTSNLILDPELDAYYVMDATLLRIPGLLVASTRAAAMTTLAQAGSGDRDEQESASDQLVAAVAFTRVRADVTALDDGLRKSIGATQSRTLGPGLLSDLDRLRDTVTGFSPPSSEVGVAITERPAAEVRAQRAEVREAALAFEAVALTELDALLVTRADAIAGQRRLVATVTAIGLGLVLALGAGWWWARRRVPQRPEGTHVAGAGPDPSVADLVGAGVGDDR